MADQLEKTEIAQRHHERVTAEIPITVSDSARLDMFPPPEGCVKCGRSSKINGNEETILFRGDSFEHYICDDRWDP